MIKNLMTKEKRYNTLSAYLKAKYGKKVFKVALDGGFTCPNKDGSKGTKGCIYCTPLGSGDFAGNKDNTITKQFSNIKARMSQKWSDAYTIAYFQANTNTYKPVQELDALYNEALMADDSIVGLNIGTRCDALTDEVYTLLESYNQKTDLTVELGLQSIHDKTSKFINRLHSLECFETAVKELRKRNIEVVVHIINGFHIESKADMIETVKYLNQFDIQGVKIHLLHVMKHTQLGHLYEKDPFSILSLNEYVDIVCDQLEWLRDDIIIHRLTGDAPKALLIEPKWSLKKFVVMNEIDKEMRRRDTYQGAKYHKNTKREPILN
ncbi:MAG: TIGR01212 family radical SAM protein [Candidatus Izemoplasma sp.]|nr:TIGR01212 family radical SAM protein [Candidatus Izemoplasma sp.]